MPTVRPVLFTAEMASALWSGRKSQTRRLPSSPLAKAKPGDLLYVREPIWQVAFYPMTFPSGEAQTKTQWGPKVHFVADGDPTDTPNRHYPEGLRNGAFAAPAPYATWLKRPNLHHERRHSRMTLEVTGVTLQGLQDITEEDAKAEGMEPVLGGWRAAPHLLPQPTAVAAFVDLWDELHAEPSWHDQPTVARISFRVVKTQVDILLKQRQAA